MEKITKCVWCNKLIKEDEDRATCRDKGWMHNKCDDQYLLYDKILRYLLYAVIFSIPTVLFFRILF